jgi:hypothetical protein
VENNNNNKSVRAPGGCLGRENSKCKGPEAGATGRPSNVVLLYIHCVTEPDGHFMGLTAHICKKCSSKGLLAHIRHSINISQTR